MEGERTVAGLRCGRVLAELSEYVDGGLDPALRARIEEHLRGCDNCLRFGHRFGAALTALRERLTAPDPLPAGVGERLRARLARERG
jgi:anti-sigma factor RsiW